MVLSLLSVYILMLAVPNDTSSLSLLPQQQRRPSMTSPSTSDEDFLGGSPLLSHGRLLNTEDRRSFFRSLMRTLGVFTTQSLLDSPEAEAAETSSEGLVSTSRVADLLHAVPTFTIVDRKGVPFMVVGEDAKPTGYFFTEYDEASRILQLASQSAVKSIAKAKKEKEQDSDNLVNPWKDARVSTVPLDFAATIVTKSMSGSSRGGAYFQIAPSEADVEDALAITGKVKLAEGKVPLFYYKDFEVEENGVKTSPIYFRKSELVKAYRSSLSGGTKGSDDEPEVLVSELFAVLGKMVDPKEKDEDVKMLVFVPPKESKQKADECIRKGGKEPPFLLGQRNLVL